MVTEKEMEEIFLNEIPLEGLAVDSGIYEFHTDGNKSIGISYENIEDDVPHVSYIFNMFINGEYINIPGNYESIYDAIKTVTHEWNKW
jgi:hypothetical protein